MCAAMQLDTQPHDRAVKIILVLGRGRPAVLVVLAWAPPGVHKVPGELSTLLETPLALEHTLW